MDVERACRTGLLAVLKSDGALLALLPQASMFDHVPDRAVPPYLALADQSTVRQLDCEGLAFRLDIALEIWTDGHSRKPLWTIGQAVHQLIENAALNPGPDFKALSAYPQGLRTDRIRNLDLLRARFDLQFLAEAKPLA